MFSQQTVTVEMLQSTPRKILRVYFNSRSARCIRISNWHFGDEDTVKYEPDGDENMSKLLSKIKRRSKIKKASNKQIASSHNAISSTLSQFEETHTGANIVHVKKKNKKESLQNLKEINKSQKNLEDEVQSSLLDEMSRLKFNQSEQIDEDHSFSNKEDAGDNITGGDEREVFPVIGDFKFKKKNKVRRVLPDWLANPSVVSVDLKNLNVSVDDIPDLQDNFITNLKKNNILYFFPVQAQVIPWLLSSAKRSSFFWPCDICVSAPTGSGKTLAYVIPILQAMMGNRIGQTQALVVLPVQELAAQVASVFKAYSVGTGLRIHLSTGGLPLQDDRTHLIRQRLGVGWESLVDILVITPGRLVEHLYSTPGFSLKQLQYIVIDEADRIVDNMQNNWLHHLDQHLSVQGYPQLTPHNLKTLPRRPQKLLFSATLSIDPEKLNQLNLFQPRLFTSVVEATKDTGAEGEFIGKFTTPAELQEYMVRCMLAVKPLVLYQLIKREGWTRVLVFTSSSRSVHQLCALLTLLSRKTQHALSVAEVSAECSPSKRETVLADFAAGKLDVLVSTDALARGMDIAGVRCVISYDVPKYVKAYIHRVGRTGRAGQQGLAVTMVQHTQVGLFQQMLQTAGKQNSVTELTVEQQELTALEEPFKEALKELKNVTEGEEMKKLQLTKSLKRVTSSKVLSKKRKKKIGGSVAKKLRVK